MKIKMQDIWDALMSDSLGGEINAEASIISDNGTTMHIRCWNGDQYTLKLQKLVEGTGPDLEVGRE